MALQVKPFPDVRKHCSSLFFPLNSVSSVSQAVIAQVPAVDFLLWSSKVRHDAESLLSGDSGRVRLTFLGGGWSAHCWRSDLKKTPLSLTGPFTFTGSIYALNTFIKIILKLNIDFISTS